MNCPFCGATYQELRVLETAHTKAQVRRRRKCGLCSQTFSTAELVVKDGQRTSTKELVLLPEGMKDALTS